MRASRSAAAGKAETWRGKAESCLVEVFTTDNLQEQEGQKQRNREKKETGRKPINWQLCHQAIWQSRRLLSSVGKSCLNLWIFWIWWQGTVGMAMGSDSNRQWQIFIVIDNDNKNGNGQWQQWAMGNGQWQWRWKGPSWPIQLGQLSAGGWEIYIIVVFFVFGKVYLIFRLKFCPVFEIRCIWSTQFGHLSADGRTYYKH